MNLKKFEEYKKKMAEQFEMYDVSEITEEQFISDTRDIISSMEYEMNASSFEIKLHGGSSIWDTPPIQFKDLKCETCKGTYKQHPDENGSYLVENVCFSNDGWIFKWFCCDDCLRDYIKKLKPNNMRAHMEGYSNGRAKMVKV